MKYLFAGDPMCSWCYGFAKELDEARRQLPELELEINVAGLWAGGRAVLDATAKQFRLAHWARVEAAAGVPFNRDALLARQDFVYDTEPISRAFVTGKHLIPEIDQLPLFRALQKAFYVDGLDTTSNGVLREALTRALAEQGYELPAEEIGRVMELDAVREKTQAEFERVRSWGLRSFPQLLYGQSERFVVLHAGFEKAEGIVARIRQAEKSAPDIGAI